MKHQGNIQQPSGSIFLTASLDTGAIKALRVCPGHFWCILTQVDSSHFAGFDVKMCFKLETLLQTGGQFLQDIPEATWIATTVN